MTAQVIRCAIEEVAAWYPRLFLEPHLVAFVAVTGQYSVPPAAFQVECERLASHLREAATPLRLEVAWSEETIDKAERLRATLQSRPLVELAAVAVGLLLAHRVLGLGSLDVTRHGDRADYRSPSKRRVLEFSGTERLAELGRRHREKVKQARANPFGWDAYVVVCAFCEEGHRVRLSFHRSEEAPHDTAKG
jgi:hypothetical protein